MSSNLVSIGTAARELDVSVDTIRRWNKCGLIKAIRDKNKKRLFNTEEIARLKKKMSGGGSLLPFTVLKADDVLEDATCIDLFAGAGGTALGFAHAGFTHTLLNEYDQSAAKTLEHNNKAFKLGCNIDSRDVHEIDFSNMKAKVIQAGFPCQAFSYVGKSRGFDDTRGTLFFEFARAIKAVKPIIAIGENVRPCSEADGALSSVRNTPAYRKRVCAHSNLSRRVGVLRQYV